MLPRKAPHSHRARVRLTSLKTTVHRHYKLARANRSSHGRDVFTDDRSAWCMMLVVNCHDDDKKRTSCLVVISRTFMSVATATR